MIILREKKFNLFDRVAGRTVLYHGTSSDAAKSILKNGLLASKTLDPSVSCTIKKNISPGGVPQVYTSTKKNLASGMAMFHELHNRPGKVLTISIPKQDYKNLNRSYFNPEFGNSKNFDDWYSFIPNKKLWPRKEALDYYNTWSGKEGSRTVIFGQDIPSKYIKGSKDYNKVTLKEIIENFRNR